jgi:hypothetical protein
MTWAIYTTPEDKDVIVSGFTQAGLSQGEWNRIRDYATAFSAGWGANIPVPPEHPCHIHDAATMRVVVITHGTKAGWLAEMKRLLDRPQKDREQLRFFYTFISLVPWYAVDPYPPPPGFFAGMTCT